MRSTLLLDAFRSRVFALVFAIYAAVAILSFASLMPPFENPDEFNHYNRADLVATGAMIATRYAGPSTSGGKVDIGTDEADSIIGVVRFHPERKVTRAMLQSAGAVRWGRRVWLTFDNTAIYPPFFYIPAALGIRVGQALRLPVVRTLLLSRVLAGLACLGLATAAIVAAGPAAPWLFSVLCLPMSLSQFASVSQDGTMFAAAALSVACLVRLSREPKRLEWLVLLCIALDLVIMARPPYAPLAIIPLLVPGLHRHRRRLAALAVIAPALVWSGLTAAFTAINAHAAAGVAPATQLLHLVTRPAHWLTLVRNTYARQGLTGMPFIDEFVGLLGWTDLPLPSRYYTIAKAVLVIAVLASCSHPPVIFRPGRRLVVLASLLLSCLGLFVFEYASWDGLDADRVNGVQGRYFIPLALLVPAILPGWRLPRPLSDVAAVLLLVFPAFSIAVVLRAITLRYYV